MSIFSPLTNNMIAGLEETIKKETDPRFKKMWEKQLNEVLIEAFMKERGCSEKDARRYAAPIF